LQIVHVRHPFSEVTRLLSGDQDITMSLTLPLLLELQRDINNAELCPSIKANLNSEFTRRFRPIYDSSCLQYHPIYATATYLDPRYGNYPHIKPYKHHVHQFLERIVTENGLNVMMDNSSAVTTQEIQEKCEPPPKKLRMSLLDRISAQNHETSGISLDKRSTTILEEMTIYENSLTTSSTEHPLIFWRKQKLQLPRLHDAALSILVMRVSSTPSERLFSLAGQVNNLLRN
jgi:hypothetical protein